MDVFKVYEGTIASLNNSDTQVNKIKFKNPSMAMIIWCTVPNALSAMKISKSLVESKLVACVNIVPGIKSVYQWENKIQESEEQLLLIKTGEELFPQVRDNILKLHEYEVPEIIGVPITHAHQPYLDWILSSTKKVN